MRSKLLAFSEWLMIFPAILFLTVTVVRFLQPRQYEPAHTSWVISEWITGHASRAGAAVVFVALPSVVAILGCALFGETWKRILNSAEPWKRDWSSYGGKRWRRCP